MYFLSCEEIKTTKDYVKPCKTNRCRDTFIYKCASNNSLLVNDFVRGCKI